MIDILKFLDSYRLFGEKRLENGTYLIGKAPHIAPNAWLHSIYSGLNLNEIKELENILGKLIPEGYRSFLEKSNGLKIFNTTFCLDGLRRSSSRGLDDVWQPFDIRTPNISERPKNALDYFFFIGGYDWDGSLLYIDTHTEKIHLCNRDNADSLYEWNDFERMLESEILRIINLFDSQGKEIDPRISTLPTL
ncbi:SMI1/KNR4 family protein [Mucilaginibacter sp.]|uniref:SMI1/KNR4 family protein n=1 Tax=Mucilaginibacter sp. TaxID=1882438 RepID=UPI0025E38773|nr:SMI1/KNR4 family protein [Mucilaginibacter sp.]